MKQRKKGKNVLNETNPSTEDNKSSGNGDADAKSPFKINYNRIILRCLGILGVILLLNYMNEGEFEVFASQKEEISSKKVLIPCSTSYANEVKKFPGCAPKKCARVISDSIVNVEEAQVLMMIAEKGLSLGGSDGGASILDLHSGALSKGEGFINVYSIDKSNKIITKEDLQVYKHVKNKIKAMIADRFGLEATRLYLTHPTFISRITSQPPKTVHDEYWHPHVDKETYPSFHYTSLLYLTDYGRHFSGGRFVFIDEDRNRTVEPRIGRVSAFTSGSENLHYVEKVTGGTRFAITVSFTCDPKHRIEDPQVKS